MRLSELSEKKVVSLDEGVILGYVQDCEFHQRDYQIQNFIVVKPRGCVQKLLPWFFPCDEVIINVESIVSIGEDVVLVQCRRP